MSNITLEINLCLNANWEYAMFSFTMVIFSRRTSYFGAAFVDQSPLNLNGPNGCYLFFPLRGGFYWKKDFMRSRPVRMEANAHNTLIYIWGFQCPSQKRLSCGVPRSVKFVLSRRASECFKELSNLIIYYLLNVYPSVNCFST